MDNIKIFTTLITSYETFTASPRYQRPRFRKTMIKNAKRHITCVMVT